MIRREIPQRHALELYLTMLAGRAPDGEFFEIRSKATVGMRQEFVPVLARQAARDRIVSRGQQTDTYLGVVPRVREAGTAQDVARAWVAWVDCDTPASVAALVAFRPRPSLVIRSGGVTDGKPHLHAYWSIRDGIPANDVEAVNRRLAAHLGADTASTDPARILRPPATVSFKRRRPVVCTHVNVIARYTLDELLADAPVLAAPHPPRPVTVLRAQLDDPLRSIPASEYVPALTGRPITRDGKVTCPWHAGGDERTPSLHAYNDPGRGWHCYGCDVGGSIIDFGARLYGITPRGAGFHEVRRRLACDLGQAVAA